MTMNLMSLKRTTSTTWEASSWKILTKVRKIPRTTTSMTKNTYNPDSDQRANDVHDAAVRFFVEKFRKRRHQHY